MKLGKTFPYIKPSTVVKYSSFTVWSSIGYFELDYYTYKPLELQNIFPITLYIDHCFYQTYKISDISFAQKDAYSRFIYVIMLQDNDLFVNNTVIQVYDRKNNLLYHGSIV